MSLAIGGSLSSAQTVDYQNEVQPLLAKYCYACHGPDSKQRQADLRLDQAESALSSAIEPGDPDSSELIHRLEAVDDSRMPPREFGKQLSPAEIATLRAWIAEGAPWKSHWAFEPIQRPTPPDDPTGWSLTPVDQFVRAQQMKLTLTPSPPADRVTKLRRLYFDLIGIGPTPEEVAAYLSLPPEKAWEQTIDTLFKKPQYGERWAVDWLDASRYADTNGYQNDFYRSMWPWRDWVIRAFNDNMPFDQFLIEQLAGDFIPNPTRDQLIATGFNRNNHSVTEGGSIEEEWRIENAIDRLETTATTFLGLTVGCARCHDHKYDPVSQQEFYQLMAFFNNIDELGVYTEVRGNVEPLLRVPTAVQLAELERVDQQRGVLQARLVEVGGPGPEQLAEFWRECATAQMTPPPRPRWASVWSETDSVPATSPGGGSREFTGAAFAPTNGAELAELFQDYQHPFSWTAWVQGDSRGAIWGKMDEQQAYRGFDAILLPDGRLKVHLISRWTEDAIAVLTEASLMPGKWNHVAVTYSGSGKAAGIKIFLDGQAVKVRVERDSLTGSVATDVPWQLGGRHRSEFLHGQLGPIRFFSLVLSDDEVRQEWQRDLLTGRRRGGATESTTGGNGVSSTGSLESSQAEQYAQDFLQRDLRRQLAELDRERERLIKEQQTTMIMRERPQYRETYLLNRGMYDQPDTNTPLWPGIPKCLPPLSENQPANRWGMAQWMVDSRNPLTARVTVNRVWARFFGTGLVSTLDNFGLQGAPPSHPELLDWLAADFRENGWDLQRLQKQILLSQTYQQASEGNAITREQDPDNRWLTRGPRYRLAAEQIRDQALAVSGLLVERQGGPSVFPYQPEGLWEELAGGANDGPYRVSEGPDRYRRSLYTYRKRTVSHPTTSTFDAPAWEFCQVARARTNTPLQALAMLNDVTYVEASVNLAARMIREGGGDWDSRLRRGFWLVLSREPRPEERDVLSASWQKYLEMYRADVAAAKEATKLLSTQTDSGATKLEPVELAAMSAVAAILLNLDEALTQH